MRASIVNVCSRLGVVKVNKWFTLRAAMACGTSKPLQNGRFSSDRQHFSHEFMGNRGLDRPFREILDGLLFDSSRFWFASFLIWWLWRLAVCDSKGRDLHARRTPL